MSVRPLPAVALMLASLLMAAGPALADGTVAPGPQRLEFGYPSPEAALADLRQRQGVVVFERNGWTVADDKPNRTWWSFTPAGHPAHPSGVKRVIVQAPNGDVSIAMSAKCGAPDEACEALLVEFHLMNDQLRQRLNAGR